MRKTEERFRMFAWWRRKKREKGGGLSKEKEEEERRKEEGCVNGVKSVVLGHCGEDC